MNYKEIKFNSDRTIYKDFSNRNISQHSHNVECVNLYLPKTIFTTNENESNTVRIAFQLSDGSTANDKYCTLNINYIDDVYYLYQCVLSSGYTKASGPLKMSVNVNLDSTINDEPITSNVWVSSEFKLNVLSTAKSTFEIDQTFEQTLTEQVESDLNQLSSGLLATNANVATNTSNIASVTASTNSHIADNDIHVELTDKTNWDNHVSNDDIHVTAQDKANWNNYTQDGMYAIANNIYETESKPLDDTIALMLNEETPTQYFVSLIELNLKLLEYLKTEELNEKINDYLINSNTLLQRLGVVSLTLQDSLNDENPQTLTKNDVEEIKSNIKLVAKNVTRFDFDNLGLHNYIIVLNTNDCISSSTFPEFRLYPKMVNNVPAVYSTKITDRIAFITAQKDVQDDVTKSIVNINGISGGVYSSTGMITYYYLKCKASTDNETDSDTSGGTFNVYEIGA